MLFCFLTSFFEAGQCGSDVRGKQGVGQSLNSRKLLQFRYLKAKARRDWPGCGLNPTEVLRIPHSFHTSHIPQSNLSEVGLEWLTVSLIQRARAIVSPHIRGSGGLGLTILGRVGHGFAAHCCTTASSTVLGIDYPGINSIKM